MTKLRGVQKAGIWSECLLLKYR